MYIDYESMIIISVIIIPSRFMTYLLRYFYPESQSKTLKAANSFLKPMGCIQSSMSGTPLKQHNSFPQPLNIHSGGLLDLAEHVGLGGTCGTWEDNKRREESGGTLTLWNCHLTNLWHLLKLLKEGRNRGKEAIVRSVS